MTPRRHSLPLRNEPESRERHEIVFYDWGDAASPHTTICVHGLTRNARDFDALARALVARGRRVIAINMAGRGESAWLKDPMLYQYSTYINDCLAVMDNFHLRGVEWVGTSMGGLIGMMIAAQQPDRIKKLVLNDIGMFISRSALMRIYDYVRTMPDHFATREEAESYLAEVFKPFGITDPEQWREFVNASLTADKQGGLRYACDPAIAEPLRVATKDFTEIEDVNLSAVWEKVRIPVFILHGRDSDVLTWDTIRDMRLENARTESITIPGVGHAPPLMSDEQTRMVTDWLAGKSSKPMAYGL